jgi:hypothetical protein
MATRTAITWASRTSKGISIKKTGNELRHTLGTRIWGAPMPVEYNVEFIYQFGSFGAGTIQAWSIASAARYNFSEQPLKLFTVFNTARSRMELVNLIRETIAGAPAIR